MLDNTQTTMDSDRCWICLENEGDWPPMARPGESRELIQVCNCSLKVHKRCLLSWVAELEKKHRNDADVQGAAAPRDNRVLVGIRRNPVLISVLEIKSPIGAKLTASDYAFCPQCRRQIVLSKKPSWILGLDSMLRSALNTTAQCFALIVIPSAALSVVAVTVFCMLASAGTAMWRAVAPESVITTIMGVKERSLQAALDSNSFHARHLWLLSGFPVFLYTMYSGSPFAMTWRVLYPASFGLVMPNGVVNPRHYLWFFKVASTFYDLFFQFTFNRLYYRFAQVVSPSMGGLISPQDLENLEDEEISVCEIRQRLYDEASRLPWYKKVWSWVFPSYTAEDRAALGRRSWREYKSCLQSDFSKLFNDESCFVRAAAISLWPYAGSTVGTLLERFTPINHYLAKIVHTPDEGTYACNLVGMALVALGKDLLQLFLAWKQTKYHQDLDIVDQTFTGIKVTSVVDYSVSQGEDVDYVLRLHRAGTQDQSVIQQPLPGDLAVNDNGYPAENMSMWTRTLLRFIYTMRL